MGIVVFILLVIFGIIVFVTMLDMKAEIRAQKRLIFSLRDQIWKLQQGVEKLRKDTEEDVVKIPSEVSEQMIPEIKAFPLEDKVDVSALSKEKMIIPVMDEVEEAEVPVVAVEKEIIVLPWDLPTQPKEMVADKPVVNVEDTKKLSKEKKPLFSFNSENWVGVNLLNRLGALLIVIGAIATAAFDGFPSWVRTLILFAFAMSVIALGEVMNRKKPTTASIGVTAVGVALVYIAVAASYFVLGTLGMYPALIACILATALGIYLAIRNDAQVVACFALIGGYLPIFALDPFNDALTIGLVVYFVFLSTYSLSLALAKKWAVSNFIGLFLTIAGTTYLGFQAAPLIALLYACFAFLVYTILPLISAYKTDKTFGEADVILVLINAFVSSIIVFLIAMRLDIPYIHAYLSAIFALIYIGLAGLIKHLFQHKNMATIFALKAIAFCILFVPFTFDQQWFAVAWLIEAVVLASYGILRKQKIAEYSGLSILGIAMVVLINSLGSEVQFTLDYIFFSIGLLVVLGMYIKQASHQKGHGQIFKWLSLANFWVFLLYILNELIAFELLYSRYITAIAITLTLLLAWIYVKIKLLTDNGMHIIANVMHFISVVLLWSMVFLDLTTWAPGGNSQIHIFTVFLNMALTFISVAMAVSYRKTVRNNKWVIAYKNINLFNLWLMMIFVSSEILFTIGLRGDDIAMIHAVTTLILSLIYIKVKVLTDRALHIIVNIMHAVTLYSLLVGSFHFASLSTGYSRLILNFILMLIAITMVVYYKLTEKDNKWIVAYKNINLVCLWILLILVVIESLHKIGIIDRGFISTQLALTMLVLALIYIKTKVLVDRFVHVIVNVMHAISIFLLWYSNLELALWGPARNNMGLIFNLIVTLLSFTTLIYYQKTEKNNKWISIYKNIALVNTWLSLIFILGHLTTNFEGSQLLLISITFLISFAATRIPVIADKGATVACAGMQIVGLLWLATFNLSIYESMFMLLLLNAITQLIALIALNDLIKLLKNKAGEETPFKILILSGYFLLVLTQGIMVQGQIAFTSAIISILFGITALAWIVLGFYLKNKPVRRFGLYLSIASAIKLLVVDTWGLSTPMRIGSYLTLGVVLMIISFVYQKFNIESENE